MRVWRVLTSFLVGTMVLGLGLTLISLADSGQSPELQRWSRPEVVVTSSSFYISADGDWLNIVGEVENRGEVPAGWVRVRVSYRDATGRVIGTDMGYPLVRPLFPGRRAPFHLLDVVPPDFVTYTLRVSAYGTRADPLPDLLIRSHSWFTTATGIHVLVGELENPLDVPISRLRLPISLYDAAGQVVNVVQAQVLREVIPPHGRSPFVARVEDGPVGSRAWSSAAQYRLAEDSALPAGLALGAVTPYMDANGYLVLRGAVGNYDQERVNFVRLVGALYDDAGTILNASFSYPLTYHLDPGEVDLFEVEFRYVPESWSTYRVVVGSMP